MTLSSKNIVRVLEPERQKKATIQTLLSKQSKFVESKYSKLSFDN